jgi:hypothetical protein
MLIDPREQIRTRNSLGALHGSLQRGGSLGNNTAQWRVIESQGYSFPDANPRTGVPNGTPLDYVLYYLPLPAPRGPRPSDESWFVNSEQYLRTVLANHDWEGVGRWYAFHIAERLKTSGDAAAFWDVANVDLRDYTSEEWNFGDLRAFYEYVFNPYVIVDVKDGKMGLGAQGSNNLDMSPKMPNIFQAINDMFNGDRYPRLALGWVREPGINWGGIVFKLVAGGIIGAGVFAAYNAIAAGLAASQAASAAAASAATAGSAATTALAPAVFAAPTAGAIETVVVTAAAIPTVSIVATVGGALAAGGIAVAAAPAPFSAPDIQATPLQEVVTTATRLPVVSTTAAATGATAGAVLALAQPPAPLATNPAPETTAQENSPETSDDQTPTLLDSVKESLSSLAGTMGLNYVRDYLAQLLAERLGRQPTDAEILAYDDWLNNQGNPLAKAAPWILALVIGGAILTRKKKGHK